MTNIKSDILASLWSLPADLNELIQRDSFKDYSILAIDRNLSELESEGFIKMTFGRYRVIDIADKHLLDKGYNCTFYNHNVGNGKISRFKKED